MIEMKTLREKAILVHFRDSVWGGVKRDRKVAAEVAERAGAKSKDVGLYNRRLVSKRFLALRVSVGLSARDFHKTNTLPWLDDGVRVLPATNFQEYMARMRKYEADAKAADALVIQGLSAEIKDQERMQGKLFNAADYPSEEELRTKFDFRIDVLPLPDAADWRIEGLSAKDMAALQKDAQQEMVEVQKAFIQDLWTRMAAVVEHVHERLTKGDAVFRNSLIDNVKEMVALLAKLNITGDKALETLRKEVEKGLASLNPDELRADPALRTAGAKKAADILKKMQVYMGKPKATEAAAKKE